jgi:hypothetical protein
LQRLCAPRTPSIRAVLGVAIRARTRARAHALDLTSRVMKRLAPAAVIVAALAAQPACYGSYGAFKSVHRWNGTASGNKVVNSAIHLGLWILPVYELCLLGDFLIFNNIEFLTGNAVFK